MALRVVTINTWNGVSMRGLGVRAIEPAGSKPRRTRALLAELDRLDADVVLLQECMPEPAYSQHLAAELGYAHFNKVNNGGVRLCGVGIPGGLGDGEGLAILVRPALDPFGAGNRLLCGVGITSNAASIQLSGMYHAMAVGIRLGGRRATVINVHVICTFADRAGLERAFATRTGRSATELPAALRASFRRKAAQRRRTMTRLARLTRRHAHHGPVIVGGDFNLDPDHPEITGFAAELDLVNVLPAFEPPLCTWDPERNRNVARSTTMTWLDGRPKSLSRQLMSQFELEDQCPDHLLVSESLADSVLGAGIAFVDAVDGVQASDHFGVWMDLAV